MKKGISGEGDQADAIPLEKIQQILGDQLGPSETRRSRVGGEHALGSVDGDDDIAAP